MINVERPRCRRCKAVMWAEHDLDGPIWKCMSCGEEIPMEPVTALRPTTNHQGVATDWKTAAKNRLTEILAELKAFDGLRTEAEQIVAALNVAQVAGLPELSWKARKSSGGGGHSRTTGTVQEARQRSYPQCAKCRRQFTVGPQYQRQPDGSAICRDGCPGELTTTPTD